MIGGTVKSVYTFNFWFLSLWKKQSFWDCIWFSCLYNVDGNILYENIKWCQYNIFEIIQRVKQRWFNYNIYIFISLWMRAVTVGP